MVRKFAVSLRKSAREAEEDGAVNVMAELSPRLAATGGAGAARRHPRRAQAEGRDEVSDPLLRLPPIPERDCDQCGQPTKGVTWWMEHLGCSRCAGDDPPPRAFERQERLQLLTDALDFIALVAGTTCTQGPTATHPDYCLKCRADALMRRAGRAR